MRQKIDKVLSVIVITSMSVLVLDVLLQVFSGFILRKSNPFSFTSELAEFLLIWVGLKLVFQSHRQIFFTSSFEVLMIIIAWLLPVLTLEFDMDPNHRRLVLHACIESILVLLAMKIMLHRQPQQDTQRAQTPI